MLATCVGNKRSFKKNEGKRLGKRAQAQLCLVLRKQNKKVGQKSLLCQMFLFL